ncbi:MAG TPA: GntR family transcriptional regulator [Anaeromyxobacter sp.]|nr:GntR family transcriptional regulator [Anaeromyxobacter sp.]
MSRAAAKARERGGAAPGALSAIRVDPADQTPLYLQVRRGLAKAIQEGRFKPEEALPSERDLAGLLGVSRVTARKALDALSREGVVVRRHGSGNYIAPRLEQPLSRLTSFTEELRQRGFTPSSRWIRREVAPALPEELLALGISPSSRVARLERVRLADEVPMAFETSVLPAAFVARPEQVKGSLYEYLREQGFEPVRALQHFRAVNAGPRHAKLLSIPRGAALVHVTRISYLADGRIVEVTQTFCRNDYYEFVVELRR